MGRTTGRLLQSLLYMPLMDITAIREILPHRYPFLLVDSILELEEERIVGHEECHCERTVFRRPLPGLPGHARRPDRGSDGAGGRRAGAEQFPDRKRKLVLLATVEQAKFRRPVPRAISFASR